MSARLSAADRAFMMTLPKRDSVLKSSKGLSESYLIEVARVADLKKRELITVAIDWDASSTTHVVRHIALTPAGIAALHPVP